jgi:zinc transporter ZupT
VELIGGRYGKYVLDSIGYQFAGGTGHHDRYLCCPYISKINEPLLGALLSFSAGALVYVGATHLLPQAEAEHKKYSLLSLGAGILVALVIIFSKA